jgi:hypothetical protein
MRCPNSLGRSFQCYRGDIVLCVLVEACEGVNRVNLVVSNYCKTARTQEDSEAICNMRR